MREMGGEIYFRRENKEVNSVDRFLVVVTFVGQAGVQMQGFPSTHHTSEFHIELETNMHAILHLPFFRTKSALNIVLSLLNNAKSH